MSSPLFNTRSLRRRLLELISVAALLIVALSAGFSYRQARHDVEEMMDTAMVESGSLLLALATQIPGRLGELPALLHTMTGLAHDGEHDGMDLEFQIVNAAGMVVARSSGAPPVTSTTQPGFTDIRVGDVEWRSLTLATASGNLRIQMFQAASQRDTEALEIATQTIQPVVFTAPLLLLLIYLAIRRGLQPLNALAGEVGLRTPENLGVIDMHNVPAETVPLVLSLNRLLKRLDQSLDNERRFTADAAHELRTPLAAIRVQAQVALASADDVKRRHALNQVVVGVERATRLVEQLLRLARLDPLARLPSSSPIDLAGLVAALYEDELASVPERADDFTLALAQEALLVNGDRDLLAIAVHNLIDNARRYTPPGCRIIVFADQLHGSPIVGVRDEGAGVGAEELPKLIERFYRGAHTDKEGTGLGLAIVRRIAELHGARLEVANVDGGGFEAHLRWHSGTA